MLPLERYKNFKQEVEKIFSKEVLGLSEDIKDLYDALIEEEIKDFYAVYQEGDFVIKIRPINESDKYLYFNNIEGFSLREFDKSILIVDHVFGNSGFMYAMSKNRDIVLSKMNFDGNSPYFHIKKNEESIINNNFENFNYILFLQDKGEEPTPSGVGWIAHT